MDGKVKHEKGNIQPMYLHIQQAVLYVWALHLKIKGLLIFACLTSADLVFVKLLKSGNGHTIAIWEQRWSEVEVAVSPLTFKH